MDKIPGIGEIKRLFEIFIPGILLILNVLAVAYCFPFADQAAKGQKELMANPTLALLATVPSVARKDVNYHTC